MSTKRKAEDELISSPPTKRQDNKKTTSTQQSPHHPSSTPQSSFRTTLRLSNGTLGIRLAGRGRYRGVADELLCRIHSGIRYVAAQHRRDEAIEQTTRFEIDLSKASFQPALDLLRRHAILIFPSSRFEVFELGMPRPDWVKEGGVPGVHDPQWWVGKTAAQIKAGPFAKEHDVKRAADEKEQEEADDGL
ncbi:hypothetical protein CFE70_002897 [Pyrenophora teres f. teres 0-1]|uniref:Uncharacterized protein n=2 Tax=Pyrenophora teres f. teres TaxID=97479 RepID=E3RPM1_PYRTT|nr:hypothetical protein PTT_10601 [Pyrenophora teres f. teres 0-1]KAE8823765.1 hypothetical protein PTNB85_09890 [Pyrenophora teres f. teres]KAE8846592.1 hypothetical protein HRS9139_01159 [Pyrenophora teres f. teres]KAE8852544.1 hypothetical protein PTNB29_10445 [Pyrenophora teres f. teres]KAK1916924.1 hypothetical protein P3342_004479 [Pyrenophora teres f. teres]